MVIVVQIDTRQMQNMLTGFKRNLPKAANRALFNSARLGGRFLKEEALAAGIKHWGGGKRQLFSKQTTGKRLSPGVYVTVMPRHGRTLDEGNYWVTLKRGRLVTKWAKDRGLIPNKVGVGGSIFVKPHPFIRAAVTRMVKASRKIINREIKKTERRKGKR